MSGAGLSSHSATEVARRMLDMAVTAERHQVGFGNQNWIVREPGGLQRWVLKVGPLESEAKWHSAHLALDHARSAGLSVPEVVGVTQHEGCLVRLFTWVEGRSAGEVVVDPRTRERFEDSLASVMRRLHSVGTDVFSSRLDGSAPTFARWSDYVTHRLGQIGHRCRSVDAIDEGTLGRCVEEVERLAHQVGEAARPTLCHRDLHPDNLLVDETGAVIGVIDWDQAESWDPAGEWYKLEWFLAEQLRVDVGRLTASYFGSQVEPMWPERVRLVQTMEALNAVPNAVMSGGVDFERRCRQHLARLLD